MIKSSSMASNEAMDQHFRVEIMTTLHVHSFNRHERQTLRGALTANPGETGEIQGGRRHG